jgi:hypothetical protein
LGQPARWEAACKEVETSILAEADFTVKEIGQRAFSIRIEPPTSEIAPEFRIWLDKDAPEDQDLLMSHFAHQLASEYMSALERDLKVAHLLKGSLGSTLWSHQRAISAMSEAPDPASVALHVSFPTLENVPINELIAIRSTNQDAFIAFRNAITRAAREMSANNGALNHKELSNRITLDVIEPELANLNQRLRSAKRSLTRKAATTIVLSSVGTLCAASLGLFPAAAIGALGTAAAISNISKDVSKYIDEKREIELSDMYFIWKALNHAE